MPLPIAVGTAQAIFSDVFLRVFEALSTPCMLLTPGLEIVAATQAFLSDSGALHSEIVGRSVLDVFADASDDAGSASMATLIASLEHVRSSGQADHLPSQWYALRQSATQGGVLKAHHWCLVCTPVLNAHGTVIFLWLRFDPLHQKQMALALEIQRRKQLEKKLRRSERRSSNILATATDAVITADREQRIEIFNSAAEAMFGCSAASAIGTSVERFMPERFRANHAAYFRQFIASSETARTMGQRQHLVGLRANGEEFPMEASISKVLSDGDLFATVVIRDISVRHATEAALKKSEERLRLVQQIGRTGTFDWNIVTNTMQWSAEIAALYGLPAEAFESQYDAWRERVHPQDMPALEQRIRESLHSGVFDTEWRVVWPDGTVHWLAGRAIVYKNASGQAVRMLGVNIDVSERKEHEERLRRMAQHDALTGLPNRTLLYAFAERLVSAKRRVQDQTAFLFIDLDRFKQINDRFGHDAGDAVLKEVARRLATCMRSEDLVGRLGGDEFVAILAPVRSEEAAAKIALHALDSLGQPYLVAGHELQVTPSIGISLFPQHGASVEELIQHADAAMYVAKQRGCNNVQFYQHAFDARSEETRRIGARLHQALELHEFELYVQPVVHLATGKPVAAEALIRWPSMAVPPARFLPASEAAGMMPALGIWILQEAARLWQHWRARGLAAFPITVNLSESQLRQADFLQNLAQVMEEYGMQGEDLELEITEGMLVEHLEETLALLRRIREKKVLLTLDDFGAGCSSMDHLTQWPLNVVKLDQSIVKHLGHDCKSALIAESVINMATSLNLSVVATGIESQEALDFLKSHHCHFGQGFHICHPLPAAEFETWCLQQAA